jgi:hypothetical protein
VIEVYGDTSDPAIPGWAYRLIWLDEHGIDKHHVEGGALAGSHADDARPAVLFPALCQQLAGWGVAPGIYGGAEEKMPGGGAFSWTDKALF